MASPLLQGTAPWLWVGTAEHDTPTCNPPTVILQSVHDSDSDAQGLRVAASDGIAAWETTIRGSIEIERPAASARRSVDNLLELLRSRYASNEICVSLSNTSGGPVAVLRVDGEQTVGICLDRDMGTPTFTETLMQYMRHSITEARDRQQRLRRARQDHSELLTRMEKATEDKVAHNDFIERTVVALLESKRNHFASVTR